MTTRYRVAALLASIACTPTERPSASHESSAAPSSTKVERMLTALATSVEPPQREPDDELGLPRGGTGRSHLPDREWSQPRPGDPLFACQRDDECAIVHLDACTEANGGWILSVRRDRLHEARYRWQTTKTSDHCTLVGSLTTVYPRCGAGTCMRGYRWQPHALERLAKLRAMGGGNPIAPPMVANRVPRR
jgi:hypothetical protein